MTTLLDTLFEIDMKANDELTSIAHSVISENVVDITGLSNFDKWAFVQNVLTEVKTDGFFASIDFNRAYDWEVDDRLKALAWIAFLRSQVYLELLKRQIRNKFPEQFTNQADFIYHTYQCYWLKLRDKTNALQAGQKSWTHTWLN